MMAGHIPMRDESRLSKRLESSLATMLAEKVFGKIGSRQTDDEILQRKDCRKESVSLDIRP